MGLSVNGSANSKGWGPFLEWNIPYNHIASTSGGLPSSQIGVWTDGATFSSDVCSIIVNAFNFDLHSVMAEVYGSATAGTLSFTPISTSPAMPTVTITATNSGMRTILGPYAQGTYVQSSQATTIYNQTATASGWAQTSGGVWIVMNSWYY